MGLFDRWHESRVKNAISVLNTTTSKIVARGAINTLIRHPDADQSVIPSLADCAVKHPDPFLRQLAEKALRKIAHIHKDPDVKERAGKALKQLEPSSGSCRLK
jgi:hypothetical protein